MALGTQSFDCNEIDIHFDITCPLNTVEKPNDNNFRNYCMILTEKLFVLDRTLFSVTTFGDAINVYFISFQCLDLKHLPELYSIQLVQFTTPPLLG